MRASSCAERVSSRELSVSWHVLRAERVPSCAERVSSRELSVSWHVLRAERVFSFSFLCRALSVCLHVPRELSVCVNVSAHIEG
jgi:hypothetical protein